MDDYATCFCPNYMKIILLEDVPKVGNRYDVKTFKDGFAQNVLIARGLAILATSKALSRLDDKKDLINKKKDQKIKTFTDLIKSLESKKLMIKVKCNEKGHLFKSVNSSDIVEVVKSETGLIINENDIDTGHIKELGKHIIKLKNGEKEGKFEIDVVKT